MDLPAAPFNPEHHSVCGFCEKLLPDSMFTSPNEQRSQRFCKDCAKTKNAENALAKKNNEKVAVARQIFGELLGVAEDRTESVRFSDVVNKMVGCFGGSDGFVKEWYAQFNKAMVDRKGSVAVLQHFLQIFKLIAESNKQDREDDILKMDLDQLQKEQNRMMLELVMKTASEPDKQEMVQRLLSQLLNTPAEEENV